MFKLLLSGASPAHPGLSTELTELTHRNGKLVLAVVFLSIAACWPAGGVFLDKKRVFCYGRPTVIISERVYVGFVIACNHAVGWTKTQQLGVNTVKHVIFTSVAKEKLPFLLVRQAAHAVSPSQLADQSVYLACAC